MHLRFVSFILQGLLLCCLLFQTGCGYRLAGELNLLPHIKTIAVPILQNQTTEPDIEKVVTEALIARIQSQGQLRITTTERADAVLYGSVSSYTPNIALSFTENYQVREYRLEITANVELRDRNNQVIWSQHTIKAKTEYSVSDNVSATQDTEKAAQRIAASELARDLLTLWEGL
jgi:outer membrane lipopolysaccharide assembly protein LptE/RlpB